MRGSAGYLAGEAAVHFGRLSKRLYCEVYGKLQDGLTLGVAHLHSEVFLWCPAKAVTPSLSCLSDAAIWALLVKPAAHLGVAVPTFKLYCGELHCAKRSGFSFRVMIVPASSQL